MNLKQKLGGHVFGEEVGSEITDSIASEAYSEFAEYDIQTAMTGEEYQSPEMLIFGRHFLETLRNHE